MSVSVPSWFVLWRGWCVGRGKRERVLGSDASPVTGTHPTPTQPHNPAKPNAPHHETLRANPFPKVTDLVCRLPLPTFVHRPEADHLGDRMRIPVRPRATANTLLASGPRSFTDPRRGSRHDLHELAPRVKGGRCFPSCPTSSPGEPLPTCDCFGRASLQTPTEL